MRSNNYRIALTLAAAVALTPVTAEATISRAMQFDDKVENAATIVLGKVVRQQAQWDAERKWILTYSTLQVEKTLKGQPSQEITIVTPGGIVGSVAQEVVGVPKFRQGDEHVVFVRQSKAGPTVLYLEQGAYRVDNESGSRIVKPLVSSAVLVDSQRGTAVAPEHPRPLRQFEGEVQSTIRRGEQQRMRMIEQKKLQESSFLYQLQKNKVLVLLALVGAVLATWQLVKRS